MREAVAAVMLMTVMPIAAPGDPSLSARERAEKLHRESIVIDGHNDVATWLLDCGFDLGMDGADRSKRNSELWWILGRSLPLPSGDQLRTHTDVRRLKLGGVDAQFFSIFADPRRFSDGKFKGRAIQMIDVVKKQVRQHEDDLALAVSSGEVRALANTGRMAVLLGLEGGHAIEGDLTNLTLFYDLGVRYMTLTWSNTNEWADSSTDERRHGGLTDFGRDVVREMNDLGMLVDVSHVSDETFWDALEVTTAPIIASHSSARALVDVPRNMSDDMLRAVARNGGIVMVNFGGSFIDPAKAGTWGIVRDVILHLGASATPLDRLLDHIEHVARVAGIDHVGLGSDFDGTLFLPEGARDVSGFPSITAGLIKRGHSEDQIRQILGENLMRVFAEAETVAARSRGPAAQQASRAAGR